jgi:hypothetical protein
MVFADKSSSFKEFLNLKPSSWARHWRGELL